MILTDYLETKLLDHLLKNTAFSSPATLYFGLYTATPSDAGGGTEATGGSYARAGVTNNTTSFPQCAITGEPVKSNAAAIVFPTATAGWGTITHWGIFDASTSGNLLAWGALSTSRVVASGDTPRFAAGIMSITATNGTGGGLTPYAKRKLLDLVFGATAFTPPTAIHSGAFTSYTDATTNTEWTDAAYGRLETTFGSASSGVSTSMTTGQYSGSCATGGSLTSLGIWDASTDGNLLAAGPLGTPLTVNASDSVSLAASAITVTFE